MAQKIGENTKFSPYRCSVCFWLLFIRTFDRHRHRLYKHNDLSPEHFLDSIIGMITGPIDTILNIILFVPLGFFLPLLYKKYHHMKTVALTGFLFSLAVEIVQMFGWGSSDINDLMTNTAGACIGFLVYCLLSRILPANLKKQLQSSRVNAVAEVLLFAICTFAIMVTAQTWFVHDGLNVP